MNKKNPSSFFRATCSRCWFLAQTLCTSTIEHILWFQLPLPLVIAICFGELVVARHQLLTGCDVTCSENIYADKNNISGFISSSIVIRNCEFPCIFHSTYSLCACTRKKRTFFHHIWRTSHLHPNHKNAHARARIWTYINFTYRLSISSLLLESSTLGPQSWFIMLCTTNRPRPSQLGI